MNNLTEMIKAGDPMLRIKLPTITLQMLKVSAKQNKRRVQDQFIKTLAQSFRNNEAATLALTKYIPDLQEVYQQK